MTEPAQPPDLGLQARKSPNHPRVVVAVQLLLISAAAAAAVLTAHEANWKLDELGVLIGLAILSDLTAARMPSSRMLISGSFLSITLAAVLLGGAPAAIVGACTMSISLLVAFIWFGWRGSMDRFLYNLVTFAWFPLLSGLAFRSLSITAHVDSHDRGYMSNPTYYLLVFATFVLALVLNLLMIVGYEAIMTKTSLVKRLAAFRSLLAAELASAVLTIVAALITLQLGVVGLSAFALVLVVFQYLVRELLISQQRGEELRKKAATDDLTGLANRKEFGDSVNRLIAELAGTESGFGLLLLDLDHFKDINDSLGHQYGDDLLVDLGPRLAKRVGDAGVVARFGGDEFAILPAVHTDNLASLKAIAEDVLACVHQPVALNEITLQVDGSIGVARYPHDGRDAQTLLRRADIALYAAKDERNGHRFYMPGQDRHSASRLSMIGDFRRALEAGDQILVHFHPIVDLRLSQVHGAEALVRWQHPTLGLLQPAAFLEIVEQSGLIQEMTTVVLDKAVAECAAWHAAGRELTVAVNLAVRNLHDPMLSSHVAQMLDRYGLNPESLTLEITESMILSEPQRALMTVKSLSEIGVRFAVDDFGTGHSSLANLRMLPVHELKIDRSFVTPMLNDASDSVIVRSTIELGHALGLTVVAEGVENATTLSRLEEIRCDRAQGHFFAKPVPPIEFMRWISRYEAAMASAA